MSQTFNGNAPKFICDQDQKELDTKFFNDPIHGHIQLHPLLVKVIDTPQFQRLRHIKQLGGNYFVYPGASHNRFEHCIGTCHLAGKLARHLQDKHGHKLVDDRDILCVELAGLCHDLGHGPFSHMFDLKFLPKLKPSLKWKHEKGSCLMLRYLIDDNKLEADFIECGLKPEVDIVFIEEMINGATGKEKEGWNYKGRDQNKSFLYEIVSNERNKVDVDKWDYFARDCHHLGIKNSFDHNRFMKFLKVLTVEGENPQICARDKEYINLYEMFHTRGVLHRRAYQHRVGTAVETMICDALTLANDFIQFVGTNGKKFSIADTVNDMEAFMKLTDHVYYQILYSTNEAEQMVQARGILNRILRRDLYKYVGQCKPPQGVHINPSHEECENIQKELAEFDDDLSYDDIVVNVKKIDFGMNDRNPCDQFRFYSKQNPNVPYQIRREEISRMLPDTFEDCEIRVFCKTLEKREVVKRCLKAWCKMKDFKPPNTLQLVGSSLTPIKQEKKRRSTSADQIHSAKSLKFTTESEELDF